MINGQKFLVTGKNLSLLLQKLNLKKIPFYDLEELDNKIYITIQKKDITRFIDLIGKTWYYKSIKKVGLGSIYQKISINLGLIIGAIIFLLSTFCLDNLLLSVKIEADTSLHASITEVLKDNKVKKYSWFSSYNLHSLQEQLYAENPLICYSSVYKNGNTLVIKAQKATLFSGGVDKSITELKSTCSGEILSLKVLRGYPLKKVGDKVEKGEIIVSGQKVEEDKEYKTFVVATATILCTYTYESTEKESFALAKAKIDCNQEEYIFQEVKKQDDIVRVTLKYLTVLGE